MGAQHPQPRLFWQKRYRQRDPRVKHHGFPRVVQDGHQRAVCGEANFRVAVERAVLAGLPGAHEDENGRWRDVLIDQAAILADDVRVQVGRDQDLAKSFNLFLKVAPRPVIHAVDAILKPQANRREQHDHCEQDKRNAEDAAGVEQINEDERPTQAEQERAQQQRQQQNGIGDGLADAPVSIQAAEGQQRNSKGRHREEEQRHERFKADRNTPQAVWDEVVVDNPCQTWKDGQRTANQHQICLAAQGGCDCAWALKPQIQSTGYDQAAKRKQRR